MQNDFPPIPADLLRRLGEKADGRRGELQAIVRIGTGDAATYDVLTNSEIDARRAAGEKVDILLTVDSARRGAMNHAREGETIITITTPNKGAKTRTYKASEVDAVFLTESAVEKFALPYYAGRLTVNEYDQLIKRYYDSPENTWGIIHYPTSIYDVIGDE